MAYLLATLNCCGLPGGKICIEETKNALSKDTAYSFLYQFPLTLP